MPTTVTGTLQNISGGAISSGTITFTLVNYGGSVPYISGTALLVAPLQVSATADGSGNFSISVYPNNLITPSTTFYQVNWANSNGVSIGSAGYLITGNNPINLNSLAPISSVPISVPPTADSIYARLDASNQPFTNPITVPGLTLTGPFNVSSLVVAGAFSYGGVSLGIPSVNGTLAHYNGTSIDWQSKLILDARDYGAVCDGTTNDSTAIQAAINAASALKGGTVQIPGKCKANVTLPSNVTLSGLTEGLSSYEVAPNDNRSQLIDGSSGASAVITVASGAKNWAVDGLYVRGTGSGAADRGIYATNASNGIVDRVTMDNFGEEGLRWESGLELHITNSKTINCLLTRTRAAHFGTVYMGGDDGYIEGSEFNASTNALVSSNQYIAALMLKGSNTWVVNTINAFSDVGIYVDPTSSTNMIIGSRVEFNFGRGLWSDGNANVISSIANSNSASGDNAYSAYYVTAGNNLFAGNRCFTPSGNRHKYCYEDTLASDANKNVYAANQGTDFGTALYKTNNVSGAAVSLGDMPPLTIADGVTAPDVGGRSFIAFAQSTPATITNFVNGVGGQTLVLFGNPNVTIQHNGATIFTANGADETLEANKIYRFTNISGAWYEDALPKNGVFNGGLSTGTLATGTAPIITSSTTLNTNLNADMLGGVHQGNVSAGHVVCFKDATHLGYCSDTPSVSGTCTCN